MQGLLPNLRKHVGSIQDIVDKKIVYVRNYM